MYDGPSMNDATLNVRIKFGMTSASEWTIRFLFLMPAGFYSRYTKYVITIHLIATYIEPLYTRHPIESKYCDISLILVSSA